MSEQDIRRLNYNLQPDTSSQTVRNGDSYDLDTREQLEADVREWIDIATYKAFTPERMLEVMLHWLDRQAAITKNECREEHRKRLGELHDLLDEAARKREELAWRVEYNGELVEKVKRERNELQNENDALKERISQSAAHDTAETAENGASKSEIRNFDDSREQLEADLHEWVEIAAYKSFTERRMLEVMHHWLYRQAAITTAECTSEDESCCEACRAAQKRKIAELTAEIEQLKRANRIQAQSFQKLEAELARKTLELAKAKGGTL